MFVKKLIKYLHAGVDGLGKIFLLSPDDAGNVLLLVAKLGVLAFVLVYDHVDDLIEERLVHAEELSVTRGAAEQTAEDIAPALVGGKDAVADHKGRAADVVGDDAQGNVHLMALAVICAGKLADLVGDVHDCVDVKERVNVLADDGKTFETHAGVDILLLELGVVVVAVVVELGKDVVPDLHIAVTVAADGAAGLAAAEPLAAVIVYLGAGTAGTGAMFPEVVLLAEAEYALGRNAYLLVPDVECLVVVNVNGGVESVGVKADPLGRGEELPAPCDGLVLKVVAEGEVAQHFKISAVAGGLADVLDVAGAYALLAGADAVARRLLLALEIGLHGRHAGVYEQKARVVLRYERKAGKAEMSLALKKAQKHFTKLIYTVFFHFIYPPKYFFSFSPRSFHSPRRQRKALFFCTPGSGVSSRRETLRACSTGVP